MKKVELNITTDWSCARTRHLYMTFLSRCYKCMLTLPMINTSFAQLNPTVSKEWFWSVKFQKVVQLLPDQVHVHCLCRPCFYCLFLCLPLNCLFSSSHLLKTLPYSNINVFVSVSTAITNKSQKSMLDIISHSLTSVHRYFCMVLGNPNFKLHIS